MNCVTLPGSAQLWQRSRFPGLPGLLYIYCMKQRRYCTSCSKRKYTDSMRFVYYSLLKKGYWHCLDCLSCVKDNLHFISDPKNRYLIELFSGSKTVSSVAENDFGYRVFNVDIEEKYHPALCTDIAAMRLNQIPDRKQIAVVWCSVPCQFFTVLNIADHWDKITFNRRRYHYIPKTVQAKKAILLLEKTLWIIRKLNPDFYFIENPRGALRHMPQMNAIPFRYEVSYNDFGFDVYKPTDIFTNCNFLQFPKIKTAVGRSFNGSIKDGKNSFNNSLVPPELIASILKQIDDQRR